VEVQAQWVTKTPDKTQDLEEAEEEAQVEVIIEAIIEEIIEEITEVITEEDLRDLQSTNEPINTLIHIYTILSIRRYQNCESRYFS